MKTVKMMIAIMLLSSANLFATISFMERNTAGIFPKTAANIVNNKIDDDTLHTRPKTLWESTSQSNTEKLIHTIKSDSSGDENNQYPPITKTDYCNSGGRNSTHEFLNLVWIGSIQNNTGSNNGYEDFTDQSTSISRVGTVTGYLRATFGKAAGEVHYSIWIDYNHNRDFSDSGELVASISSASTGYNAINFTVPPNAMLGATRMRITMSNDAYVDPCELYARGETEDYTVVIGTAVARTAIARPAINANENSTIKIYPNPVSDILYIKGIGTYNTGQLIEIFDATGRKIMMNNNTGNSVNASALTPGSFIIRVIQNNTVVYTGRFIKK